MKVRVNKMFKNFEQIQEKIYFDENYYNKLFTIISILGVRVEDEVKTKLKEEYINLRSSYATYFIERYKFCDVEIYTEDNMLCFDIYKRGDI